jgi:hypothetical protein
LPVARLRLPATAGRTATTTGSSGGHWQAAARGRMADTVTDTAAAAAALALAAPSRHHGAAPGADTDESRRPGPSAAP